MYPSWRATVMVRSLLTTEDRLLLLAQLLAGCVTTPALRLKKRNQRDFLPITFYHVSRVPSGVLSGGILKGGMNSH